MSVSRINPWLRRFSFATALLTLCLIGVGGLVTSHEAGMAVPDWPNTYGYNMFLFPISKWIGGIFYEHSHRLVASLVGLLTTILAGWCWARETRGRTRWIGLSFLFAAIVLMGFRKLPVYVTLASLAPVVIVWSFYQARRQQDGGLRWLSMAAFAAVVLQGVLGGLRVVWFKDEIGIFHATLAQLFLVLICIIAVLTTEWWQRVRVSPVASSPLSRLVLVTAGLVLVQLVLGATMRHQHAGLAIPDFPLAYGKLWPAMDAQSVLTYNQQRQEIIAANPITAFQIGLQMAHRLVALLILAGVAWCAWMSCRSLGAKSPVSKGALAWLGLVLAQALLGAATIWSNKAADIATAHVLLGSLCLVTGAFLALVSRRFAADRVPARSSEKVLPVGSRPVAAQHIQ